MASFQDLGLREPLLAALEDAGIERPTALQAAAIPVLRREGNLVARAGSGSGKTLAYGLGVLDRIQPRAGADDDEEGDEQAEAGGTRVLVLSATPEAAARAAMELVPFAQSAGLSIAASGGGWGTRSEAADVLVATPHEVMEAVRTSAVKLEGLEAVVIDGAAEIESVGGWEQLETLFDHVPRDAQRVIVTSEVTDAVEDLAGRRVKRAIRYPATAADPKSMEPEAAPTATIGYVPVGKRDKIDVVARLLGTGGGDAPVLYCRTDERAAELSEALSLRGFLVSDAGDEDADVIVIGSAADEDDDEAETPSGQVISYDVPADEETLRARHGGEDPGFVLVEPRELAHLRDIAKRAGFFAQPAGVAGDEPVSGSAELRAFRGELRRALREEDLAAQMLILEPLFEDFTPTEIAAAASALLRRKRPAASAADAMPAAAAAAREAREPRTTSAMRGAPGGQTDGGGAPAAYTRLFVSLGERDGVRANDLVGAIAGEADIPGTAIGKIEIRDTFSIVEVPADAAGRVISSLNGTTIRNRSVRVDYDRPRTAGGPGGPGGMRRLDRGGGERGGDRGGARGGGARGGPRFSDDRGPRGGGDRGGGRGGPRSGGAGGARGGSRGGPGGPRGGGRPGGGFRRPRDE
jgi:ATP-dependent RNA helicase DeaD